MLRPGGPDPDDLPITTLGHHHVTVRQLGPGSGGRPGGGGGGGGGAAGASDGSASGAAGGPSVPRVHIQEVLSFDPNEGPKQLQVAPPGSAPPAVVASFRVEPRVKVKAKRLGRDVSIKVRLDGGGHVALYSPSASAVAAAAAEVAAQQQLQQQPLASAAAAAAAAAQEQYTVVLPNLVLRGNLPYTAHPEFKGELVIQCPSTGLMATLTFKEDGVVKGVLEKLQPQQQQQRGRQGSVSGGSGAAAAAAAAAVGVASRLASVYGTVGSFAGSLYDSIQITCPELGLEGTLHSEQPPTPGLPPLAQLVDLTRPGPQQLPRMWTALHDALLYNDPSQASGGKAAEELSRRLASGLHALFVEGAGGAGGAGGGATAAGGGAATATAASVAGAAAATDPSGGVVAGGSDSDSDFEAAARDEGDSTEDPRDVPPSYKSQHAAGRQLCWQLQYTLLLTTASPAPAPAPVAAPAAAATEARVG
ncbi:hypothetical protein PLESTB_000378100 [Pleodorina starrii]|uniref:Uncharacterized protein n=1 Tax=Pleodorina starrii TaxID=330485 RepID=A0A9W6BEP6_9CHLO|nr:hypothetical protein PLESTB_000378100 [Pleodorina starrii]